MALNIMTYDRVIRVIVVYMTTVLVMLSTPAQSAPRKAVSQEEPSSTESRYRRVCYYTNWSQYRKNGARFLPANIDPFLCTHIVFAFAKVDSKGRLAPYEWNDIQYPYLYRQFTSLKKKNPKLRALLAVGGWTLGSGPFTGMVRTKEGRRSFVDHALQYLRTHGFDGLDLDWEYPANRGSPPEDKDNFSLLLRDLREGFVREASKTGKPRLLLAAAVAGGEKIVRTAYDVPKLNKYLDFISLMSYDLHGSWSKYLGHNAPLYGGDFNTGDKKITHSVNDSVQLWLRLGASREKLVMGMPFYGRSFTTCGAAVKPGERNCGVGKAAPYTREKGFVSYYEMLAYLDSGWQRVWLDKEKVPYAFHPDTQQWVGYDDLQSIQYKAEYIQQEGLGGAMFWALDLDDFAGLQSDTSYPLAKAVRSVLAGDQQFPQFDGPPVPGQKKKKKIAQTPSQRKPSPPTHSKRPQKNPKDNVKHLLESKKKSAKKTTSNSNNNHGVNREKQSQSKLKQIKTSLKDDKHHDKDLETKVKARDPKVKVTDDENVVDSHEPDSLLSGLPTALAGGRDAVNSATRKPSRLTLPPAVSSTTRSPSARTVSSERIVKAPTTPFPSAPVRTGFAKSPPKRPLQKYNDFGRNSRVKEKTDAKRKSGNSGKRKAKGMVKTKMIKSKTNAVVNPFLKFKPSFLTSISSVTLTTPASVQTTLSPVRTSTAGPSTTAGKTVVNKSSGTRLASKAKRPILVPLSTITTTRPSTSSIPTRRPTTSKAVSTSATEVPESNTAESPSSGFNTRPAVKWWEKKKHKASAQTKPAIRVSNKDVKPSAKSSLKDIQPDLRTKTSSETRPEQDRETSHKMKSDRVNTKKYFSIYQAELPERQKAPHAKDNENDITPVVKPSETSGDSNLTSSSVTDPTSTPTSSSVSPLRANSTQSFSSSSKSRVTWTPAASTYTSGQRSSKLEKTSEPPSVGSKWLFEMTESSRKKIPSKGGASNDTKSITTPKTHVSLNSYPESPLRKPTRLNTQNSSDPTNEKDSKSIFTASEETARKNMKSAVDTRTRTPASTSEEITTKAGSAPALSPQSFASSETTTTSGDLRPSTDKTATATMKSDLNQNSDTKILSFNVKSSTSDRESKNRVRNQNIREDVRKLSDISRLDDKKETKEMGKPVQHRPQNRKTGKPVNSIYSGLGLQQDFEASGGNTDREGETPSALTSTTNPATPAQRTDAEAETRSPAVTKGKLPPRWFKWTPPNTGTVFPTFTKSNPTHRLATRVRQWPTTTPPTTTTQSTTTSTTTASSATPATTSSTTPAVHFSTLKTASTSRSQAQENNWMRWTPSHGWTVFPTFTTKVAQRLTPTPLFPQLPTISDDARSESGSGTEGKSSEWMGVLDSEELHTDLTVEAYKNLLRSSTMDVTRNHFNTFRTTKADSPPPPTKQTTRMLRRGTAILNSAIRKSDSNDSTLKTAAQYKIMPSGSALMKDGTETSPEKVSTSLKAVLPQTDKAQNPSTKTAEKGRSRNPPRNTGKAKTPQRNGSQTFLGNPTKVSKGETPENKAAKWVNPKIVTGESNMINEPETVFVKAAKNGNTDKTIKSGDPRTSSPKTTKSLIPSGKSVRPTSSVQFLKTSVARNGLKALDHSGSSLLKQLPVTEHLSKEENRNTLWKRLSRKLPRQQEEDPWVRVRTKTHPPRPTPRQRGAKQDDGYVVQRDRVITKKAKQLKWWEKTEEPKRARWWERKPTAEAVMQVYASKDLKDSAVRDQKDSAVTESPMIQGEVKATKACDEENDGKEFKATGIQPENMRAGVEVSYKVRHPGTSAPSFETLPEEKMPVQSEYQPEYQPAFLYDLKHYEEFHCPNAFGIYTDPDDCSRFYQCVWMIAFHHTCGPGTVWNDEMKICDWPTAHACRT